MAIYLHTPFPHQLNVHNVIPIYFSATKSQSLYDSTFSNSKLGAPGTADKA